jgi:transcriptional regulator with XRE-family HTH domain
MARRKRTVVVAAFGQFLRELRGERSRAAICRLASAAAGFPIDQSVLLQYERGTVTAPDPVILHALATVYGVPIERVLDCLKAARVGRLDTTPTDPIDPSRRRLMRYIDVCSPRQLDAIGELLDLLVRPATRPRTVATPEPNAPPARVRRRA